MIENGCSRLQPCSDLSENVRSKMEDENNLPGLEAVNIPDDKLNIFPLFVMIVSQTTTDSNVVYALFDNAI